MNKVLSEDLELKIAALHETTDRLEEKWGPEFPGIQEAAQSHDLLEVCALQWKESVQAARKGLQSVPDEQQLELHFETLVQSPERVLRRVFDFADLADDLATIRHAENEVHSGAAERWRDREADTVQRVMKEVGDLIRKLDASREEA